jgi:hypothetical protein
VVYIGQFQPVFPTFLPSTVCNCARWVFRPPILDLYRLEDGSTAVHYSPLPGHTLRQVLQGITAPSVRQTLVERFGKFMAQLHEQGVTSALSTWATCWYWKMVSSA